jgi:hypothetical protein
VIIGLGVATMHYIGMSAMSMQDTIRYNLALVGVSVLIAVVAGTAALLAGLHVGGVWSSLAVSLIMGVAVTGMHYTGMAAMHLYPGGSGMTMSGHAPDSFLFPLILGVSVLTFVLGLVIALSPNEEEILADARLSQLLAPSADAITLRAYSDIGPESYRDQDLDQRLDQHLNQHPTQRFDQSVETPYDPASAVPVPRQGANSETTSGMS